ncbi:unnamed protein product [Durusdinium trenchii]|uniref:Pentatricopeptide repeat-containing protein, chloroplastic n=1 Tax=Durusdinium trenchii TaxID=1381693 RepID=A0ABP0JVJ6_9DINO
MVAIIAWLLVTGAAASGWKDCGDDWTGCCKQDAKYSAVKPLVTFTNVTELNARGEADVVHINDPFFTIEVKGKSLAQETISNITVQIRGYWSLSQQGPWLRYVNVRKDLCSDKDVVVRKGFCPMTPGAEIDKTPGPLYERSGRCTEGSEVYSFGMVMLEIMTGLAPSSTDPSAPGGISYPIAERVAPNCPGALERMRCGDVTADWPPALFQELALTALRCVSTEERHRPGFVDLVRLLKVLVERFPKPLGNQACQACHAPSLRLSHTPTTPATLPSQKTNRSPRMSTAFVRTPDKEDANGHFVLELLDSAGCKTEALASNWRYLPLKRGTGSFNSAAVGRDLQSSIFEAWLPTPRACYLSRKAIEIQWDSSGEAKLLACGSNPLLVDGQLLERGREAPLRRGSEITFGYEGKVLLRLRFMAYEDSSFTPLWCVERSRRLDADDLAGGADVGVALNRRCDREPAYTKAIRVAGEHGAWKDSVALLEELKQKRLSADAAVYSALMVAARAHWPLAMAMLGESSAQGNLIVCNAAISACKSTWLRASVLLDEIWHQGHQADLISYSSNVISCSEAGQWLHACSQLQEFNLHQLRRNSISCSSALRSCNPWVASMMLREAEEEHVETNVVCYTAAISRSDGSIGVWLLAMSLIRTLQNKRQQGNSISFNSVSKACAAQTQWTTALFFLELLRHRSLKADDFSYNTSIDALTGTNLWCVVLGHLQEMDQKKIRLDGISFSSAMLACGVRWEAALVLLQDMHWRRVRRSQIDLGAALQACASCSQWRQALSLLQHLEATGLELDVICYSGVITACSNGSEWRQALAVLEIMNRTSLASNIVPYTAAMSGCGKAKYWQAAMALLEDMELKMFEVGIISLNSAISACGEAACWLMALGFLEALDERLLQGNSISFNASIVACGAVAQWQAALDIYHQMDDQSVPASAVTFNSIMLACSNAREWQAGLMLLLNLKELRVLPDAVSYSTTICACGLGSAWQTALSLLRSLEHQRLYDLLCFSSAITACDSGGQWQRAFQIFWEARAQTELDVMCHRVAARALDEIYECPQRWKLVQGLFVDLGDRALEADLAMHTTAAKCLGEGPSTLPMFSYAAAGLSRVCVESLRS